MNDHRSTALNGVAHTDDDDDDDDDFEQDDDDNNAEPSAFAYQRLADTDDDDDDDEDDAVDDNADHDQAVRVVVATATATAVVVETDETTVQFAAPVMRIDEAIVLAEARMPTVLPDAAYARFANQLGVITSVDDLPPRPLDAALSGDDIADVMAAMSELQLAYRPAWVPPAADLSLVDEEVRRRAVRE